MKKIKLFLASSAELKPERGKFELEIYRKCKAWFDNGIFLHLDIWEDLSARMSLAGSQAEYNKFVEAADLFVLLAYSKVGMYTAAEFEKAFGQFKSTQKPFIFTYFKTDPASPDASLDQFKQKIHDLGHFYSPFADSNDLWNQFNKELERLETNDFVENKQTQQPSRIVQQGDKSVYVEKADTLTLNIQ
ncbi:hypothetical protein [Methyloglobulus sp.]|uniref:hypothetical protein n=1 Tax=Methyloglobulus sp. TaxID=2518622 RepID=UPI003988DB32